jgi:hypothetical protein
MFSHKNITITVFPCHNEDILLGFESMTDNSTYFCTRNRGILGNIFAVSLLLS